MRGCKSIQKHVKIYNISTPLPPSPPLLHIIQMFSILLHTLSINLHIFWPVLHIFVEWYVRMRDICGKFIKKLYQLRSEVLVEREAFQKRFLVLVHLEKKKKTKPREYCYQKMITSLRCICLNFYIYSIIFMNLLEFALCIITIFQRIVNRRRRKLKRLTVLSWSKDILQSSRALPPACTVIFLLSPSKWGPHLWSWWCWCLFRVLCASKM